MTAADPSPPLALATEGLGFRVGGATIIDDLSLSVRAGEFLGIIGPNGAGKTTCLNLISGTVRSTSGRILLGGEDITRLSIHKRARKGLSRTFQTSYLLLGLTALENVRLMAQARSVGGVGVLRRLTAQDPTVNEAREALERVGLSDRSHHLAGSLSHGDRRKLELAIVLAARAPYVLLDEPMAGVNSEDVDELTELIRELHASSHATFLMVEHHLHVVLGLAERIAVLHEGRLLALGAPDSVMSDKDVQTAYVGEVL